MKKKLFVTTGAVVISTTIAMGVRKGLQVLAAKRAERLEQLSEEKEEKSE